MPSPHQDHHSPHRLSTSRSAKGDSKRKGRCSVFALSVAACLWTSHASLLSGELQVLAVTGAPAPDGTSTFTDFDECTPNDAGVVAMEGSVNPGDGSFLNGLLIGQSAATLVEIARARQAAPGLSGSFLTFSEPAINEARQVAFLSGVDTTNNGIANTNAIYRWNADATLMKILATGEVAPDGGGTIARLEDPSLNDSGQTAFFAAIDTTPGGFPEEEAIYRHGGSGAPTRVARTGQTVPNGNGTYRNFDGPTINNAGQVAFRATLRNTSIPANDQAVYAGTPGALVEIVRQGNPEPGGNGEFATIDGVIMNDAGQVAFESSLQNTTGGGGSGVFRGAVVGPVVQIARRGAASPDGSGTFSGFGEPALNNAGQVAWEGFIDLGNGGSTLDDEAIFRGDGSGPPSIIAREGGAVPTATPPAVFRFVNDPCINDAGQVAFRATVEETGGGGLKSALYLFDDALGLVEIVRIGYPLLGSTINNLSFQPAVNESTLPNAEERSGLNERGEVAFQFSLADGRRGIAFWSMSKSQIRVTGVSRTGTDLTIAFEASPSMAGWKVFGSTNLQSFPDDLTTQSVITEPSAGTYQAVVDVSGLPASYFVRIER